MTPAAPTPDLARRLEELDRQIARHFADMRRSPSESLAPQHLTDAEAELYRRVMDPNDPTGKPTLRAGLATRITAK